MKKIMKLFLSILVIVVMMSFVACGGGREIDAGATVTLNKNEMTLTEGSTERLTATTIPDKEAVSFSSSDKSIATVSVSGLVSALSQGNATITATAVSSGKTAECIVTVEAQAIPTLPSGEDVSQIDSESDFELNAAVVGQMTIKKTNGVTTITYDETAARDMTWQNYAKLYSSQDLTRKTKVGISLKGNGESIWFKVLDVDGAVLVEQEITASLTWRQVEITIPAAKRYLLAGFESVIVNVPRPNESFNGGGSVSISGIWFSGDAEPAVEPNHNYEDYTVITALDLSEWKNHAECDFDISGTAHSSYNTKSITGIYSSGELTFENDGVNEWKRFSMTLAAEDYSQAKFLVISASATAGTVLKGQVDWANNFEFVKFDETKQYYFVDLSELTINETTVISLVPSYLTGGATSSEITIHSVEIVK